MSTDGVNHSKRRLLVAATSVVGAIGAGFVAYPFIASMLPSAKAQAAGAPVEADIGKLEPGQRMTVEWRGKPVWIVRRTDANLKDLAGMDAKLRDPNSDMEQQPAYAKNQHRSIKPEYLVVVGICTHLGCSPQYVKIDDPHSLGAEWKGGFFCPCHGSFFDLAGRVYQGVPAPLNLEVPKYSYINDTKIIIGVDKEGGAA